MIYKLFYKITLLIIFLLPIHISKAQVIKDIQITGNERTGSDIILSKIAISRGTDITAQHINDMVKKLYLSEYFADISIDIDKNGILNINVLENPVVGDVYITGDSQIDADDIKKQLSTQSLQLYSKNKIKFDMNGLYDVYQKMGYLNVSIKPKVVSLEDNAVDIIFNIKEGEPSYVRKINFYGNNHYTNFRLKENIFSRERSPIAFTKTSGSFVEENLKNDKQALINFYNSRGYPNMKVVNITAGFDKEQFGFVLDYFIEEGEYYKFGNITIESSISQFNNNKEILRLIHTKKGKEYDINKIEASLIEISNYFGNNGYANIKPVYKLDIDEEKKVVNIAYSFEIKEKLYIDKIIISGNTKTKDEVILRELDIQEGELYNTNSIITSKDRLIMLGYFKNVDIKEHLVPNSDLVVLEIIVEEQFFGTANVSIGYSNYFGLTGNITLQIQNFLGRGYTAGISLDKNAYIASGRINFYNPYFFGKHPIGFGISAFGSYFGNMSFGDSKWISNIPYKGFSFGANFTFTFELFNRLYLNVDVGYSMSKYLKQANYSYALYNQLMGNRQNTYIGIGITWNKMNRARYSTKGYMIQGNITFAGFGIPKQQHFIKYTGQFIGNLQLYGEDLILHTEIMGGFLQQLTNKRQIIGFENMFSLGGYQMRGFNFYGIGSNIFSSKYGYMSMAIESKKYYYGTVELRSSLFIPKDYGVYISAFVDVGAAWGFTGNDREATYLMTSQESDGSTTVKIVNEHIVESYKPRVSIGVGITWNSPMGSIGLYYAYPLRKEDFDQTMEFGLKLGTQF